MVAADKKLAEMRAHPKGGWRIDDFESVARVYGLSVRKSGGSHVVLSHPASRMHLTVPARRPIKPFYVREFVKMIDEIREST